MDSGHVTTEWINDTWASVAHRVDLDGSESIVLCPDRSIGEDEDGAIEIVMSLPQARKVARALNVALRRAKS